MAVRAMGGGRGVMAHLEHRATAQAASGGVNSAQSSFVPLSAAEEQHPPAVAGGGVVAPLLSDPPACEHDLKQDLRLLENSARSCACCARLPKVELES